MKKLLVFSMVMALVLGMTVVGLAENLAEDTIDVEVTIAQYAEIEFDVNSVDLGEIAEPGETVASSVGYTIFTNTPVSISVDKQEFTDVEALSFVATPDLTEIDRNGIANGVLDLKATLAENGWEDVVADDYSAEVTLTVAAQ